MDQVLDVRGVVRAMSRRRRALGAMVLIGLVGGVLLLTLPPRSYTAKTRVVLPPSPLDAKGNDLRDINTEVQIVRSVQVLTPVSQAMRPAADVQGLGRRLHVRGISSQIIEIAANGPTAAQAAQLANAVAGSYVAYSDDTSTSEANATAAAYATEANQIDQQVQRLDAQIASDTAALTGLSAADAQRQESVIDALRSQQVTLEQQLNVYQTRIADAQLNSRLSREGTHVLQPALAPAHPSSPRPLWDLGGGLLAGGVAGGFLALVLEQGDHRLRRREDIADALGAPILASLTSAAVDSAVQCQALLDEWQPSVVESLALRQAFDRLEAVSESMTNLVVVAPRGDSAAVGLALELAMFVASRGIGSAFIFASHQSWNCAGVRRLKSGAQLAVYGPVSDVDQATLAHVELTVTFVVADGGPLILPKWDRPTLATVAVSSGFARGDRLESVAGECLATGLPVSGVFVANPEPDDRTTGQLAIPIAMNRNGHRAPAAADDRGGGSPELTVENWVASPRPPGPRAGSSESGSA